MRIFRLVTLVSVTVAVTISLGLMTARGRGTVPTGTTRAALDAPPVQVLVSKVTKPGAATYGYRVVNGSGFEITSLLIGFNYFSDSPQLRLAPIGWDGNSVPSTGAKSPAGWEFEVTQTEDDSLVNLMWQVDSLLTGIPGGTTQSGFEVTLPVEDTLYASGQWVVYLNSASQGYYTAKIETSAVAIAPPSSIFGPNGVTIRPNPSHEGVIIEFDAPAVGTATIHVLDAMGRSMRRISSSVPKAGPQRTMWDGKDNSGWRLPPAAYLLRIQAPGMDRFAKFVLER